jgi:hypothetical protein
MSAVDRLTKMPFWPGRMTEPVAAMFMGISQTKFRAKYREIAQEEDGNVFWSYRQLQAIIDEQFALPPSIPIGGPAPEEDPAIVAEREFFERRNRAKN